MPITHGTGSGEEPWLSYESEKAVLVSDMSGFTRLTRQFGIIHFAGLIMQMRHLFARVFAQYDAHIWMTEADNCCALFPSSVHAMLAALECTHLIQRFNASLYDESFHIHMGGFGVDCGTHIIQVRRSKRLFGEAVDRAHQLGEEEANDGEVLISEKVYAQVSGLPGLSHLTFTPRQDSYRPYYVVTGALQPYRVPLPTVDNLVTHPVDCTSEQGELFIRSVLQRAHVPREQRERLDQYLATQFLHEGAVVMLGFDLAAIRETHGPTGVIVRTHYLVEMTHAIAKRHDGVALEEFLFLFQHAAQAFAAARELKERIDGANKVFRVTERLPLTGIAVHTGHLLIVPGTNVHWGDPVNTASKLAEDIASQGEFLITEPVYRDVRSETAAHHHQFNPQTFTTSRVELTCFEVHLVRR